MRMPDTSPRASSSGRSAASEPASASCISEASPVQRSSRGYAVGIDAEAVAPGGATGAENSVGRASAAREPHGLERASLRRDGREASEGLQRDAAGLAWQSVNGARPHAGAPIKAERLADGGEGSPSDLTATSPAMTATHREARRPAVRRWRVLPPRQRPASEPLVESHEAQAAGDLQPRRARQPSVS